MHLMEEVIQMAGRGIHKQAIWKHILIEDNITRYKSSFSLNVIDPPTFFPIGIPQKYASCGSSIKFVFNMVIGMGIVKTTKDLKMSI